jgi:hypothetical protein
VGEKDDVIAAAGMGRQQEMLTIFEALSQNKMPLASEMIEGKHTLATLKELLCAKSKCKRARCCKNKPKVDF